MTDKILVLNCGSQYVQLIIRRIRELGVYCKLFPPDVSDSEIKIFNPTGVIVSGGPDSVIDIGSIRIPDLIFKLNVPILGICYGMQTLALQLGGKVEHSNKKECGKTVIKIDNSCNIFEKMDSDNTVWMSHNDKVTVLPAGFINIANSDITQIAAMANLQKRWYGVQFHPEVTHTLQGTLLFENFLYNIAKCKNNWNSSSMIEEVNISLI